MAFSSLVYTADGVAVDYSVTFDYLDRTHVAVLVDNVRTTEIGSNYSFSWVNPTTVRVGTVLNTNPVPAGLEVKIVRETPIDQPAVIFGGGASLSSENLNKNSEYLTYALQEATDANDAFTTLYLGAKSAAPTVDNAGGVLQVGAIYFNNTDNTPYYWTGSVWNKGDIAGITEAYKNAAETARDAAVVARTGAETAQSLAETARTTAQSAQTAAVAAQVASELARDAAQAAQTASETAKTAAETAETGSVTARTAAESARDAALASQTSASASETAAAASASAAATSSTNAGASETAAAASAAAAAASEANAAASEAAAAASAAQATSSTSWLNITNWSVRETVGGELIFAHSGVDRMKITSTGDLTVTGEITAFGSI